MTQEKRKFDRFDVFLIVDIRPSRLNENYFLGMTRNISPVGFSFESQNYEFQAGDLQEFEIKDPHGNMHIHAAGNIAWKKATDFECLVGVEFRGIDELSRNKITALMTGEYIDSDNTPDADDAPAVYPTGEEPEEEQKESVIYKSISRITGGTGLIEEEDIGPVSPGEQKVSGVEFDYPLYEVSGRATVAGSNDISDYVPDNRIKHQRRRYTIRTAGPSLKNYKDGKQYGKGRRNILYISAAIIAAAVAVVIILSPEQPREESERLTAIPSQGMVSKKEPVIEDIKPPVLMSPPLQDKIGPEETNVRSRSVIAHKEIVADPGKVSDKAQQASESDKKAPANASQDKSEKTQEHKVFINIPVKTPAGADNHADNQKTIGKANAKNKPATETYGKQPREMAVVQDIPRENPVIDAFTKKTVVQTGNTAVNAERVVPAAEETGIPVDDTIKTGGVNKTANILPEPASEDPLRASAQEIPLIKTPGPEMDKGADISVMYTGPFSPGEEFIIHEDNFDDNTNKWDIFATNAATGIIKSGEYYLENKREEGSHMVFNNQDVSHESDFMIEADIRLVKSWGRYSYGMVFGGRNTFDNYTFQIINNNIFSIRKHQNGMVKELAGGTVNNVYMNQHNKLRIAKQGAIIRFFVNGGYLGKISDITLYGNKTGFVLEGRSEISIDGTRSRITVRRNH